MPGGLRNPACYEILQCTVDAHLANGSAMKYFSLTSVTYFLGRSPSRNPASQYDEQLHARLAELERKVQDQERTIQAQGSIMLSSSRHEALSSTHHEVASNVVNTEHQEQGEIPVFGRVLFCTVDL